MAYTQLTQEQYDKIQSIMSYLQGKDSHNHEAHIITELFMAHNMAFPNNPEYSKSCGGCRVRVYNRMKTYWSETKHLYGY